MDIVIRRIGLLAALPLVFSLVYVVAYAALRLNGTLRVNRDGWHAGTVAFAGWTLLPALKALDVFEFPMRVESRIRNRLSRRGRTEAAVSEVVVELVNMA